jgi:hypothetical protein
VASGTVQWIPERAGLAVEKAASWHSQSLKVNVCRSRASISGYMALASVQKVVWNSGDHRHSDSAQLTQVAQASNSGRSQKPRCSSGILQPGDVGYGASSKPQARDCQAQVTKHRSADLALGPQA